MIRLATLCLLPLLAVVFTACGGSAPPAAVIDPALQAKAGEVYAARCATCHGTEGRGDGPAAAALTPAPNNFTAAEWRRTATDAVIKRVILEGGAAIGKSPAMPPHPDLKTQPELLDALIAHLRSL